MRVEPAHIDQVQRAADGQLVVVDRDAGGVAEDIRRIDPCLRLKVNPKVEDCWIVYRVHRDGQPCRDDDPDRTEELVLTARVCDQRIVKRLRYIDGYGRSGYDYAQALEDGRRAREKQEREERAEVQGTVAERTAHALRKDLGLGPYRGRIFKPRDL